MARNVRPSSGWTKRSPSFGASPFTRKRRAEAGCFDSLPTSPAQSEATRGVTAKPSSAQRIAGCSSASRPSLPWVRLSSSQALIAPGIVTECAEVLTMAVRPLARSASGVAPIGARPEPFSAITLPEPAGT
jgi:hypothetical protein